MRLWNHRELVEDHAALTAWQYRAATRLVIDRARQRALSQESLQHLTLSLQDRALLNVSSFAGDMCPDSFVVEVRAPASADGLNADPDMTFTPPPLFAKLFCEAQKLGTPFTSRVRSLALGPRFGRGSSPVSSFQTVR